MYDTCMGRDAHEDEFHLRFDAAQVERKVNGSPTSFNVVLRSSRFPDVALSGLSGVLLDTEKLDDTVACVTIFDALRRHTSPKRVGVVSGPDARLDLDGGTDGRVVTSCRFVMFCWLPEIHDEGRQGVGTRLLTSLREFLVVDDIHVFMDFGVEDEKEGFVKIFYPRLNKLGLRLSESGQFAQGRWRPRGAVGQRYTIGVVHL